MAPVPVMGSVIVEVMSVAVVVEVAEGVTVATVVACDRIAAVAVYWVTVRAWR